MTRFALTPVVLTVFVACMGCGGEPPRRPNLMHPVHERRADEIIARVFTDAGLDPEQNRSLAYNSKPLRVDVAAGGRRFGIAYLTQADQEQLGDALPKHDPESDALVVISAGDNRVLLLYERDYLTDDLEGEAHSVTTIAAERKIERDAKDFVVKADHEKWP